MTLLLSFWLSLVLVGTVLGLPFYLVYFIVDKIRAKRSGNPRRYSWTTLFFLLSTLASALYFFHEWNDAMWFDHSKPYGPTKSNLGAIWSGQDAYRKEHGFYAESPDLFDKISWRPEGGDTRYRYAYFCGEDFIPCEGQTTNPICPEVTPSLGPDWPFPVRPVSTKEKFICLAVGTSDRDPAYDVWMISDDKHLIRLIDDDLDMTAREFSNDRLWQARLIWRSNRFKLRKFIRNDLGFPALLFLGCSSLLAIRMGRAIRRKRKNAWNQNHG